MGCRKWRTSPRGDIIEQHANLMYWLRMGEADVETLKRGYAALNRGDLSVVLDLLDPDIEWHELVGAPRRALIVGATASSASFVGGSSFDQFRVEPERVVQRGDQLVAVVRQTGAGRSSGVQVETRLAHVWTIADRKAVRWEGVPEPETV